MAGEGYFHVSRKMFDGHDPFWGEHRVFSRAEAWIDVVQMAAYRPHRRLAGGHVEMIARGEFLASERFLCQRWRWGRARVRSFLRLLQKLNRIQPGRETSNGTIYLLVNYESYQPGGTSNETSNETTTVPAANQEPTTSEPKRSKEIEGNKGNEIEVPIELSINGRRRSVLDIPSIADALLGDLKRKVDVFEEEAWSESMKFLHHLFPPTKIGTGPSPSVRVWTGRIPETELNRAIREIKAGEYPGKNGNRVTWRDLDDDARRRVVLAVLNPMANERS